jgi:hypothetical protein
LGAGSNNRAELIGVWTTLLLAKLLNIHSIQIIGDSKLVIDWCKGRGKLNNIALDGWKDHIIRLRNHFNDLTFTHSYRVFNKTTDDLSKRALLDSEHLGQIVYSMWTDNTPGINLYINVFGHHSINLEGSYHELEAMSL